MSSHFHFDLENGSEIIWDEVGVEATDLDQAVTQALVGVQEMRDSGELLDEAFGWQLVVRDQHRIEVRRLTL